LYSLSTSLSPDFCIAKHGVATFGVIMVPKSINLEPFRDEIEHRILFSRHMHSQIVDASYSLPRDVRTPTEVVERWQR